MYGPHDDFSLAGGHVVPSLIHRTFLCKRGEKNLTAWGSGAPLREFVYVDDIAKLALWAIDHYKDESPIIFSSGIEVTIKLLVETVVKKMDFKGAVQWDSTKPDGQFRKPSDTSKLGRLLPNFTFTSLEEGIQSAVEWFVSNYPRVRGSDAAL
jgi:GDP-L-fucose synthase